MPDTADARSRVVLAFDWGTRKIGVAVGQEITGTASPLPSLRAVQGQPDWQEIDRLIAEWEPGLFIVGIPLNMDGSESDSSRRARRFGRRLSARFKIDWIGVDERLTTREARAQNGGDDGREVDGLAARVIVESWLREEAESRPG